MVLVCCVTNWARIDLLLESKEKRIRLLTNCCYWNLILGSKEKRIRLLTNWARIAAVTVTKRSNAAMSVRC